MTAPAVRNGIKKLHRLIASERMCKLSQGDLLVELIDRHGLRAIDIARQTKQRPSDLSQMYKTCRMFQRRLRRKAVPYNIYFLAMRMVQKFRLLGLQPIQVLQEIREIGFTQHRDVTAHFAARARHIEQQRLSALSAMVPARLPSDRAYHAPFQTLLNVFDNGSIKILHVDPPYVYPGRPGGRYTAASARPRTCDNRDATDAIDLVIDLLRDWQSKLASGGVLLLWQASGPLPKPIAEAIERYGWELERVVIWDKGRAQAGDLGSAYSVQSEWLWVLSRPGDRLVNHDTSPRGDILRFAPVSLPSLAGDQQHAF